MFSWLVIKYSVHHQLIIQRWLVMRRKNKLGILNRQIGFMLTDDVGLHRYYISMFISWCYSTLFTISWLHNCLMFQRWSAMEEDEISVAMIAILAVGSLSMLALLSCYICVFRQLCCQPPPTAKRRRLDSNFGNDGLQLGETTQNVEISMTTATEQEQVRTCS